jgi:hypothetical protein
MEQERNTVVRFCTWCKEICFRPAGMRPTDALIIYAYGNERHAFWNGLELTIADGICEKCRADKFSEFPIKPAAAAPAATKEHQ